MKMCKSFLSFLTPRARMALSLGLVLAFTGAMVCRAGTVSLTTGDGFGASSFNSGLNWSDGLAPAATNDYIVSIPQLRTPADGASYTFGGHSLTINPGGQLYYKGTGSTGTITIANLILNGGAIQHLNGAGDVFNLAGNVNVTAASTIYAKQGPINIIGTLTGNGTITNPGSDGSGRTLTLSGPNLYAGSIINNGRFQLAQTSYLNFLIGASGLNNSITGTGPETIFNGDFVFNLLGASANVGDSWLIAGATGQTFGSTFGVAGFTDNGGGIWTTTQNGALYEFNTADGMLTVVPEPGAFALALFGGVGMLVAVRRSRKA